ncbi:MAG TPA: hypothetical protein VFV63_20415 [Ilumatobacteraceae bacterium]|nr:hypothetical protein [Ilumatobacteraceae bacterium]
MSASARRRLAGLVAWAAFVAVAVSAPASAQVELSGQIGRVDAAGLVGHVGVDLDGGPAPAYEIVRYWNAAGQLDDFAVPGSPAWARFEFYPDSHAYDPWTLAVGGAHIHRDVSMGPNWLTIGDVTLPKLGQAFDGAVGFRIDGTIVSSSDVPDGRVEIDAFQLGTVEFDPFIPPLPRNATGDEIGSFATSTNRGTRWTAGVGWSGRYVLFVRDMATGRRIQAIADIAPGSVPTIDLDAVCFGFYTCQYDHGAPGDTAGTFHPLTPTRVLDTRARLGIRNGPVRTGGGWSPSDSRVVRHDAVVNHELKVTGRFGVPATGVSAVLLNVTAVEAPGPGFVAVRPRRPNCCDDLAIHDDRAAVDPAAPATSNLNVGSPDAVANLVLARVGAGGTISLFNSFGPTHIVADVAGWFDTGSVDPVALGYVGAAPTRVLDTRNGTGGPAHRFEIGETRPVAVAGVAGVPDDASAVVVNITATQAQAAGYVRAFPSGIATPEASSLNFTERADRANLAVVPVGADGRIAVRVDDAATHLVIDVMGAFSPGGDRITAIEPVRVADSRSGLGIPSRKLADGDVVPVHLRGIGRVPAGATAVVLNVTVTQSEGAGYATVFPGGTIAPETSNLNFTGNVDVPNLVLTPVGADGSIAVRNRGVPTHVLVDVLGFVTRANPPAT